MKFRFLAVVVLLLGLLAAGGLARLLAWSLAVTANIERLVKQAEAGK